MNFKEIITAHFDFSRKSLKKFNFLFAFIFALITAYSGYKHVEIDTLYILGGITMFFLFTGLFIPALTKPLYILWMGFANILGFIMLHVVFSLLFFLTFLPFRIFFSIINKKFYTTKPDPSASSYWIRKETDSYNPKHFEKQFS